MANAKVEYDRETGEVSFEFRGHRYQCLLRHLEPSQEVDGKYCT